MTTDRRPADDFEVTAERPDGPVGVTGTDHVILVGSNAEDTIAFHRDLLGMPLVLRQPNLDDPESTHLFFDTGDGRILTFFVRDDRPSNPDPQRPPVGAVHHLSFGVAPERFADVREALREEGRGFNEFDRGVFHSLYTRDHNGLVIELATDKYAIPDDRRGEVLATAQRLREADGAAYAEEEHLEAALDELGIDADRHELPDAPTGTGTVDSE
ncbi:VOC family protein [Halomarina halobia]|uniref:VOC family protein n=1 Tax=Halomarina halobia TaxID=3033386 RepID=A0ABD6A6N6_9EURY|nr:VOC family protein [Halomarina sp. PSR21]